MDVTVTSADLTHSDVPRADVIEESPNSRLGAFRSPDLSELFDRIFHQAASSQLTRAPDSILSHQSLEADLAMASEAARELLNGFIVLSELQHPVINIFCGARMREENPAHAKHVIATREAGRLATEAGFSVMTGGGPGGMHYASHGGRLAHEAMGNLEGLPQVFGVRVILPNEQQPSPYLDKMFLCKYFFTRKVLMTKYSAGVALLPGGMGSLDEFFEVLKISSTAKDPFPIALVGDFWEPLLHWVKYHPDGPFQRGYCTKGALEMARLFDSPEPATAWMKSASTQRVERFYSHRQNGNHGPLAEELVGNLELLRDPRLKLSDLTMVWEALVDMRETFGFLAQGNLPKVAVVGGRFATADDPHHGMARHIGEVLGARDLSLLVPRARGLMLAATAGAREAGSFSFALDRLRNGEVGVSEGHVDGAHRCFTDFVQRVGLVKGSVGMVAFPGGIGMLDGVCEVQNLRMCGKMGLGSDMYPLVLAGTKFWNPFRDVLYKIADESGYLTRAEIDTMTITDDPYEALAAILNSGRARSSIFEQTGRIPLPTFSGPI